MSGVAFRLSRLASGAARRCASIGLTLFGMAVAVFLLLRLAPGDPISMMIGPGAGPADIAALRAHYGLDGSLLDQFGVWMRAMMIGDFGVSISLHRNVLDLIAERLPATLELAIPSLLVATLLGGALAIVATLQRRRLAAAAIEAVSGLMLAVPDFIWALALILVVGVAIPMLPLSGRLAPDSTVEFHTPFYLFESLATGNWTTTMDIGRHLLMPMLALALPLAGVMSRLLKGALAEAMVQDYVMLAQVKGFSDLRIVVREALRNAVGPTLALAGVQFTFLLGGTVVIERIFSYPGLGNLAIDAVISRDLPLIQALVLVFGLLFILINVAVDLAVAALNPRLQHV